MKQLAKVRFCLEQGAASAQDIADETGIAIRCVRTHLNTLKRRGMLTWRLLEPIDVRNPPLRKPRLWELVR